jgi:hypothetical protein
MTGERYRGFIIRYDPPPIPSRACDYSWEHEDYDGPGDRRFGYESSEEACKIAIDHFLEEEAMT